MILDILQAIVWSIFGGLCAWYYMDGKLSAMREKAKFEQESRLRLIDRQKRMFEKILADIEEIKK